METRIQTLLQEINAFVASDKQSLETYRLKYISKKGAIGELFEELKQLPPDQKKQVGKILNDLKKTAETRFSEMSQALESSAESKEQIDLTLPPVPYTVGNLHPLTLTKYRIFEIFERLGFNVADGPEIEDWHNFSALNFPPTTRHVKCRTPSSSRNQTREAATCCLEHIRQMSFAKLEYHHFTIGYLV